MNLLMVMITTTSFAMVGNPSAIDWQTDINELERAVMENHPHPFTRITQSQWQHEVQNLRQRVNQLSSHGIMFEMTRLIALIGDGHSRLTLPQDPEFAFRQGHSSTPLPTYPNLVLSQYPLRLYEFDDGLHVVAAGKEHKSLLASKITHINDIPVAEVLERLKPYVHCDNDWGFRLLAPAYLCIPELLAHLGVVESDLKASFSCDKGGRSHQLSPAKAFTPIDWSFHEQLAATPLWRANDEANYSFVFYPKRNACVMTFNEVADADESLKLFSQRMFREMADQGTERLIIDLRRNMGGSNEVGKALLHEIIRSESVNKPGNLIALIGRGTFSAAVTFAAYLTEHTLASFVGEPTGAPANAYGDSRKTRLSKSGITLRISTLYWQKLDPRDARQAITPDISISLAHEEFLRGSDLALETALSHQPQPSVVSQIEAAYERSGANGIVETIRALRNQPQFRWYAFDQLQIYAAEWLWRNGSGTDAETLLRDAVTTRPNNAASHFLLARIIANDQPAEAIAEVRKSLAIKPSDRQAIAFLNNITSLAETDRSTD